MSTSMSSLFSMANWVKLLTWGLGVYWVAWIVYARFFHPLRKIPGPFLASISRIWLVYITMRGDMEHVQRALHRKYGPLIRIAPHEVACADPEAIKTIYPTTLPLTKSDFYPVWGNTTFGKYVDNFSVVDEVVHSQRRRIVNHVYSLSNVLQCEVYIDQCTSLFMTRLGEIADKGQTLDLGEWLQWYAFDVIGQLYFGDMFGFMQHSHDHGSYIQALDDLLPVLCTVALSASYSRPFILGFSILSGKIRKGLKAVDHIAQAAKDCVTKRTNETSKKLAARDLMQQLLDIVDEKGSKVDFGLGDVQREAYVALFAGSDTTAIALRAVIYFLLKSPKVYQKLQREIDEADQSGKLSEIVKYSEATSLPFLCACVKEAMRLHPSVGLTMPRIVPTGGLTVANEFIQAGYTVGMNPAVVQYDKGIYGEDAEEFRPDRWFEKNALVMERTLLTFGAGTRTCIGKNISLSEMYKVIVQMLRHFDFELAHKTGWKTSNFWFNKQAGLIVNIRRRTHSQAN